MKMARAEIIDHSSLADPTRAYLPTFQQRLSSRLNQCHGKMCRYALRSAARYSLTRRKFDVNLSAIQNVVEKGHKPFPLL